MTAASRRRTTLPPLAAVLAIAFLALLAWTAAARAAEGTGAADGTATADGSQTPEAGSGSGPESATEAVSPPPAGASTQQDPAPPADPAQSHPGPQQAPADWPADRGGDPTRPAHPEDSWDQRSVGSGSDGSGSHESGGRDSSPSSGSDTAGSAPVLAMQTPPGPTPEGDLSLPPATQFTVAPMTAASTGGSGAGVGAPTGGVRIGCLTLCAGGTRLAAAMRLALSGDARSAVREARARANGTAAKASAPSLLGAAGAAGAGLFNLLIGGGGNGAAVVFIGFLAVLMGLFALPRDWSVGFRLPASTWRPSAYVTPIELPG